MLSTQTLDLAFDDDSWNKSFISTPTQLYRASSVGSYGVTSMGRGFQWDNSEPFTEPVIQRKETPKDVERVQEAPTNIRLHSPTPVDKGSFLRTKPSLAVPHKHFTTEPLSVSPSPSRPHSPCLTSSVTSSPRSSARVSPIPRPRRRSSQQRVSLIAGRVSIAPAESPSIQSFTPHTLLRTGSTSSFLSVAESIAPPPSAKEETFLGGRNITEFVIEGEIGRGAYGLVKRGREIQNDGSLGPPLVIKQVIKSRILADCWKKHPRHGTIPIEIYVMSAISNTSYLLPPRRPWDPSRFDGPKDDEYWVEGKTVKGHPNICPLLDFFEDDHYYYLVLPCNTPESIPNEPPPPSDLFDLVEAYPKGLPPAQIRSYLGQIADAVHFLHSHGIVHRDLKDENVVLGKAGRCILIDFGSSGLVRRGGWDTFSGTLDYAGPEILRGERYQGKEQDVWAFGVVAYVLLVGECPFQNAEEAQDGLQSPFSNPSIALDERCGDEHEMEGLESDGGGALGDAAALVRACLQVQVHARPTFEKILQCRFLNGTGWGM